MRIATTWRPMLAALLFASITACSVTDYKKPVSDFAEATRNAEDAEDIAQDVCLGLAHKLRSFRGQSRFTTWLYRVVVNACRDHARKQKSSQTLQANYAVFREHDEADQRHDANRLDWLNQAVASLEPKLRETAILVLAEDLSHGEAAEALGCAESTVSWRMHEIRKKLKTLVEKIDD